MSFGDMGCLSWAFLEGMNYSGVCGGNILLDDTIESTGLGHLHILFRMKSNVVHI